MKDIVLASSISRELKTEIIGRRIIYQPVVPSTMAVAGEEALGGAVEGTVVIAGRQTAGRGRMERTWVSPPGSLSLSVLLYPRGDIIGSLTMMAAVALVRCIKMTAGLEARLKWPNDVLINGKKVAGILAESGVMGETTWAIIGIGINANNPVDGLGEFAWPATSLSGELGQKVSTLKLAKSLLTEMDRLYVSGDRRAICEEWRGSLETLGKRVSLNSGDSVREGLAESVDEDGNFILRLDDGRLVSFAAGDVTLRKDLSP